MDPKKIESLLHHYEKTVTNSSLYYKSLSKEEKMNLMREAATMEGEPVVNFETLILREGIIMRDRQEKIRNEILQLLNARKIPFHHLMHQETIPLKIAQEINVKMSETIKSLMMRGKKSGKNYLVCLRGDQKVDKHALSALVNEACELEKIETLKKRFGLVFGGVCPFGKILGVEDVFFDSSLKQCDEVVVGCGMPNESIRMKFEDLDSLIHPKFFVIAAHPEKEEKRNSGVSYRVEAYSSKKHDLHEIVKVINIAYKRHEYLQRERITIEELKIICSDAKKKLYLCLSPENKICGTILLDFTYPHQTEIGLLSIAPSCQKMNLGALLLAHAEEEAFEKHHVKRVVIGVVKTLQKLISYYKSQGYVETGEEEDFPEKTWVRPECRSWVKCLILEKKLQ